MKRKPRFRLTLIALAMVYSLPATAGVVIEMEQRSPGSEKVQGVDTLYTANGKIDGIPVRIRNYTNGRQTQESVLRSVKQVDLDASTFQPPSGYKTKNLMDEQKKRR